MAAAQPAKAKASAPVAERAGAGVGGQAVAVAQVAGRRWRAAGVCSLINYEWGERLDLRLQWGRHPRMAERSR